MAHDALLENVFKRFYLGVRHKIQLQQQIFKFSLNIGKYRKETLLQFFYE